MKIQIFELAINPFFFLKNSSKTLDYDPNSKFLLEVQQEEEKLQERKKETQGVANCKLFQI